MKKTWMCLLTLSIMLTGLNGFGLVRVSMNCPNQFTAKVVQIDDLPNEGQSFAKQRVQLATIEVEAGEVSDLESIEILKHGPISIDEGDEVKVQTKNGFICSVNKTINKG